MFLEGFTLRCLALDFNLCKNVFDVLNIYSEIYSVVIINHCDCECLRERERETAVVELGMWQVGTT